MFVVVPILNWILRVIQKRPPTPRPRPARESRWQTNWKESDEEREPEPRVQVGALVQRLFVPYPPA